MALKIIFYFPLYITDKHLGVCDNVHSVNYTSNAVVLFDHQRI